LSSLALDFVADSLFQIHPAVKNPYDFNAVLSSYPIKYDVLVGSKSVQVFGDFVITSSKRWMVGNMLAKVNQHFVVQISLPFRPRFYRQTSNSII